MNYETRITQEPVNCSDSELCTFLQALAEGFLPTFYSDTSQSAQSKSMSIASKSYQRGKKTVLFHGFQSLMMSRNLTDDHGADSLTLWPVDSRARILASLEKAQESTESKVGYGQKWRASLAKFDPDMHSWKTAQRSLLEDSDESSVIWPRSGMTVDGECWELPMLVRRTNVIGSGLWPNNETFFHTPNTTGLDGGSNARKALKKRAEKWPTPCATEARQGLQIRREGKKGSQESLTTARAFMHKDSTEDRGKSNLGEQVGGQLNPTWVEKLMGWSDDWTSLNNISHVKMCFWLMGFNYGYEKRKHEVMRVLRCGNVEKEIQREIGRPICIYEAAILLSKLCEYANRFDEARIFMACAETFENEMRSVRICDGITSSPHRPEQSKQQSREHPDAMQALSRLLAHHGKTYWERGGWEDAIPRVANNVAFRVDRLKAIGNGQVPLCAATAWRMLTS